MHPSSTSLASLTHRHNLNVMGGGPATVLLVHGYGCNQAMWRRVAPALAGRWRVVLMDLVGFGLSDHGAYDPDRYVDLEAHAKDVAEVATAFGDGPVALVGHSVGATIGLLADRRAPGALSAHVMVSPSPCFLNDGAYRGGFERSQIEQLLQQQQADMEGWARSVAGLVAAEAHWAPTAAELVASFCRADRRAAAQLARATFAGDHRALLPSVRTPALIMQCSDDGIAPVAVGEAMHSAMPGSRLQLLQARGHCPHLTHPRECLGAMEPFLAALSPPATLLH